MYTLAVVIQYLFPLIAFIVLLMGFKRNEIHLVVSALWLSLIAALIHFECAGNQIFGTYFGYLNATVYTSTLLILLLSLIRVIIHLSTNNTLFKITGSFINALLVVGTLVVISNLWINAFFIEEKKSGTPVMQVALFNKPDYCHYKYVFIKVAPDGSVNYLCPDYYGFIASVGRLATSPDFVTQQLRSSQQNNPEIKKTK